MNLQLVARRSGCAHAFRKGWYRAPRDVRALVRCPASARTAPARTPVGGGRRSHRPDAPGDGLRGRTRNGSGDLLADLILVVGGSGDGGRRALDCAIVVAIPPIASMALCAAAWIASTRPTVRSAASAVRPTRAFTSAAATAKPPPASPARSTSKVASCAGGFVGTATVRIAVAAPIPATDHDDPATVVSAPCASGSATAATAPRPAFHQAA
ncbi:hypothetical protein [Methylobacterium radiotolerans]|uniref:hypothetical protein n=1 Tax=Methylobacterium radiotolerans TaxID=31998 RepID=UPI0038D17A4C